MNPISTMQVTGFVVSTGDAISGMIDSLSGSLQVNNVGLISISTVALDDYTVQQQTKYKV